MKVYIEYSRPFEDENDDPPIVEVWTDGERPKKRKAQTGLVFVYDEHGDKLLNQREWNGIE
jgi:hypothetical protein